MILGMSLETFTFLHVVISLVGIMTGFIVVALMLQNAPLAGWNGFFLTATILTSVTGFFFPLKAIGPPHIVGAISLVVLAVALFALYGRKLAGPWRAVYVVSAVFALYLNVFVGIVQSFAKVTYLHKLAPTGSEPPFGVAQAIVLILFVVIGFLATRRYHPAAQGLSDAYGKVNGGARPSGGRRATVAQRQPRRSACAPRDCFSA